jgi:hypothetical protein
MKEKVLFTSITQIVVIAQMPLDSSKLASRTQNQSKGSIHLNCTKSKSQQW